MNCERCNSTWGAEAAFRIRSDILNLKVCGPRAKESSDLHLAVEWLMDVIEHADSKDKQATQVVGRKQSRQPPVI
jgi:hypothetical protein